MEMNEALSLVSSIAGGIKDVKQACSIIPVSLFGYNNKQKLELQDRITSLESMIYNGFPELKKLIILYSDLKTEVSIARALSDKIAEIITLAPEVAYTYIVALIGQTQNEANRTINRIEELPHSSLDAAEAGAIKEKLQRIQQYIRDIQNIVHDGKEQVETNNKTIVKCFRDISTEYGGIESKLSELLNKRILKNLDVFKN